MGHKYAGREPEVAHGLLFEGHQSKKKNIYFVFMTSFRVEIDYYSYSVYCVGGCESS